MIQQLSKCCKAPFKAVGMGDFHDDDDVCTMHNECLKCKKPCDICNKPTKIQMWRNVWRYRFKEPVWAKRNRRFLWFQFKSIFLNINANNSR